MTSTVLMQSISCAELTCEWKNCRETFANRLDFLSHITRRHVAPFEESEYCLWQGCEGWRFDQMEHLQLHLSIHAYHHQIMHAGYKIMTSTKPTLKCYQDSSSRNIIADLSNILLCGWKDCNGEFYNYELFTLHVDNHAMEDVTIPVISKELLKTVKFARCEWVGCEAAFKSRSHLKSHLNSHTQKKLIACPVCGIAFCTRIGFLNHCYRQETPTAVDNLHSTTKCEGEREEDEEEEETGEGILTIDEDANAASNVAHTQLNIIPTTHNILNQQNGELEIPSDHSTSGAPTSEANSRAALAPGSCLGLPQNESGKSEQQQPASASGSVTAVSGKMVQQLIAPDKGERQFRCPNCPRLFFTASLLRSHQNKHFRKYSCSQCPYSAPYPARLKEHEQYRHSERRDFICAVCKLAFKTKNSQRRHELSVHSDDPEMNACKICQHPYSNYHSLNRHVRIYHLKEEVIFRCHLCEKEYNRGNNLSRHLTGAHQLKPSNGWSRFVYEKQDDGIFRLKLITAGK